jgi:hypothetical protein
VEIPPIINEPPESPVITSLISGEEKQNGIFKFPWLFLLIIFIILVGILIGYLIFNYGGLIIGGVVNITSNFIPPVSMSISNIRNSNNIIIPNDIRKTFQNAQKGTRLSKKWKISKFDNTKGLLTRRGPNGEVISYDIFYSKKGEKVIFGSDGKKYYVKGDNIRPFEDVPEFISKSGNPVINKGYAGKEYPDNVFYKEKIVYDADGKLVRWEGPIFDNVSKFEVTLPKGYLKETEQEQYVEAYRQLREWITNNPKAAIERFGAENAEMLKNGETIGNAGYHTWHHTEEVGQLQMVNRSIHQELHPEIDGKHAHTGGMEIWGAGRNR